MIHVFDMGSTLHDIQRVVGTFSAIIMATVSHLPQHPVKTSARNVLSGLDGKDSCINDFLAVFAASTAMPDGSDQALATSPKATLRLPAASSLMRVPGLALPCWF